MRALEGLLSICAYCKKIRDQDRQWVPIEEYREHVARTPLSRGICPDGYEAEVRPDLERLKRAARSRPGPAGG
ncbi:MAG: hypothetical protein A2X51_06725 [Candidatus Rokubacteria bacterium GWC2_70_24]|nr:MAG: hypothetical protein A2X53_18795 [Candidatus Rokubacteria bacterium GWA2_70_23]OGK89893.1 MAG: hypothetical protein A2X50_17350 [Candidatus Rokubacteria bacterium GWF2_70_14]OGK93052.1 MAG: hypothetical protein A2X51_06725 [Candidatus Rokubacteria bacterium GWC2_70_24]